MDNLPLVGLWEPGSSGSACRPDLARKRWPRAPRGTSSRRYDRWRSPYGYADRRQQHRQQQERISAAGRLRPTTPTRKNASPAHARGRHGAPCKTAHRAVGAYAASATKTAGGTTIRHLVPAGSSPLAPTSTSPNQGANRRAGGAAVFASQRQRSQTSVNVGPGAGCTRQVVALPREREANDGSGIPRRRRSR